MGMKIRVDTISSLIKRISLQRYCVNGRLYHTHILCNEFYKEFHTLTAEGTKAQDTFLKIVQTAKNIGVNLIAYFTTDLITVMQLIDLHF